MTHTHFRARNALTLVKPPSSHRAPELPLEERRWLHDHTLQILEYLAAGGYDDDIDVATLREVAARAGDELRTHIESAPVDPHNDLAVGVREIVADAQLLMGGVVIDLFVAPRPAALAPREISVLLNALCEALTNVRKHADATKVIVRCRASANGAVVTIADDGVGCSGQALASGTGVRHSLIGRMLACGGTASIEARPKGGTLVTLTIRRRTTTVPNVQRATRKRA